MDKEMASLPSLGLSTTKVSGAVAAAIIAASLGIAAVGALTYVRKMEPFSTWLVPYEPTAQFGGIFLYSNVIWGALWVGLFFALRHRQNAGSLRTWLLFFLVSLGIGTGFAETSLNWSQLPTVMQLGSKGSETTGISSNGQQQSANEILVKILEGSSIQGNPGYEPNNAIAGKNDRIAWVNEDAAPHTVTSGTANEPDSGKLFDSGSIGKGQRFDLTAENLGTGNFDYYCIVHPFMKGSITVQ
ncbi:MAG: cupredoxin domain-containing protein [Nitrososphaera sp.]